MGNCFIGGMGDADGVIKVISSNGGVMEFYPPVTAGSITDEFPGHAIFRTQDLFWKPLYHSDELLSGKSYYLLPFNAPINVTPTADIGGQIVRQGHVRSNSIPTSLAPYRMSLDYQGMLKRSYTDVFSRNNSGGGGGGGGGGGFWKVKLVISPKQLVEILSEEAQTEELIESVRIVAKCGNGVPPAVGFSDKWSLSSSSRNASSKKGEDLLLEM